MKGKSIRTWVWGLAMVLAVSVVNGQDLKISGVMFGDFYYIASSNVPEDTLKKWGEYGFLMRRINLTFDKKQDENVNLRVRLEMESPNVNKTREIKLVPYLKDATLNVKIKNANLAFGIQPTLVYENAEKVWGYRFVEKTVLDFQRVVPSRDFGLSGSMKISVSKLALLAARGGKSKYTIYGSLSAEPVKDLIVELSGRYNKVNDTTSTTLIHPFLGYKREDFRAGVEFGLLKANGNTFKFLSIFTAKELTRRMEIFARFDRAFQANSEASNISYMVLSKDSPMNLIFGGLSYKIAKNVSIAPNIAYAMYDDSSIKNDLYLKATINVNF